jgi:hypothetical protein
MAASQEASLNGVNLNWSSFISYSSPTPFRVNEGGIQSLSQPPYIDTEMVSPAWYLNMAMGMAEAGVVGFNIHSVISQQEAEDQGQPYPVLWNLLWETSSGSGLYKANTQFLGLMMFSKIEGQQIVSNSISGTGNVTAIATKGANGNANIIVVNDDTVNPVNVTPAQSSFWATASVLQLAPSTSAGCADTAPTLGGSAVGTGGSWSGSPYTISNGGSVSLSP